MPFTEEDVLAQKTRRTVFDYVRHVPGAHLRRIARDLDLPIGQVIYHLDYLERREMLVVKRDAGFKRFFVRNLFSREEKRVLSACRHAVPRRVLVALLTSARDGLSHGALLESVDVSASTLSFHLTRMVDARVLSREREGRAQKYALLDPVTAARVIDRFGSTFHDPVVDAFRERRIGTHDRSITPDAPARAAPEPAPGA